MPFACDIISHAHHSETRAVTILASPWCARYSRPCSQYRRVSRKRERGTQSLWGVSPQGVGQFFGPSPSANPVGVEEETAPKLPRLASSRGELRRFAMAAHPRPSDPHPLPDAQDHGDSFLARLRRLLVGRPRDLADRSLF